ncbi:MAG: hypothetical protein ACREQ8_08635 [Woeseiaceae bacterium]
MRPLFYGLPLLLAMTAPAAENSPLQAFDFLAGFCWQGEFADTQAVDTHCYTWVYDEKHLRDVHVVKGDGPDYRGETIYSVDGATGGVIFRYWNSLGGVSDGRMEFEDGALTSAVEKYVGEDGKPREFRSSLRQLDETQYEARTEELIDGKWSDFSRTVFTRVKTAAP